VWKTILVPTKKDGDKDLVLGWIGINNSHGEERRGEERHNLF